MDMKTAISIEQDQKRTTIAVSDRKTAGKRLCDANKAVDRSHFYSLDMAIDCLFKYRDSKAAKFDETIDVVFKLGVNPDQPDQMVRGSISMPAGLGKKIRIAAIVPSDIVNSARDAGADIVGDEGMIEQIKAKGVVDFDVCVTVPSMMPKLATIARILGPRGLMPNIKTGTVNDDLNGMISRIKSGVVNFKVDKSSLVHAGIGKLSFTADAIKENFGAFHRAIMDSKPATSKGVYLVYAKISTSQGFAAISLDPSSL